MSIFLSDDLLDTFKAAPDPSYAPPQPRPQLGAGFDAQPSGALTSYDPSTPDAAPPIQPWTPPPPVQSNPFGQSYDESYQPATGGYASAAGDNGQSPFQNIAGFGGSLVGWGNLAPSLQPDSGAPFAQQQNDANRMIVESAEQAGIPGGLQMVGEGARLPQGVSLMHGGPGGEPPAPEPFPEITPEEAAKTQAELIDQQHAEHYGGQAAGQVTKTGEASPDALRQPDYTQTPDEVVQGNAAALARSGGDVRPADVTAPYYDAHTDLLQRIQDLAPLQEQQAKNVTALRQRQFGGLGGALESGPGGRQGANYAMATMRGAADQVSFQPLSEVMSEGGINNLYDSLRGAVQDGRITGGDYATAKTALDNIVDGTRVPPPSGTAALEKVFPGIQASLKASPINNVPPLGLAGRAKEAIGNMLQNPVAWANNTARSIETIGDVASPGRLAPTAGIYEPKLYAKTWAQTAQAMAVKDGPQAYIQRVWDSINADPELQKFGITVDDMFDREKFGMHGAGYDPYSGTSVPSKGIPNLTTKLPTMRGVPGVGDNQLLPIWDQIARPQMLREAITNRLASGQLTPEMLQDPLVQRDLGRGIDLITGHASFRPFGDTTNLILNFGNWTAAQLETIARAAVGTVQDPLGSANVIPGVHVNSPIGGTSFTNDVARTAVGRLAALQTSLAVAYAAAQGMKPTDKRMWKDGHAVFVINPTGGNGPNIPGFKPDTQIDTPLGAMFGHLVGVGRATYEGATGGSRFGGTAPTNAADRVTGAASGAANEALYWGRGMLAWVPKTLTDVLTGSNMAGEKPTAANEAPLPINVSGFVGDNAKATGANVVGMLGGRATEPSPAAALDNALTGNPKYGAGWYDLTAQQQQAALSDPAIKPLIQARDDRTLQKEGPSADYMRQQQSQNAKLMQVGQQLLNKEITPKQARDAYHTSATELRGAYDALHPDAVGKPPTDALGRYYATLDKNTLLGNTDWEAVDAWKAQQSPDDQKEIDAGTGISGSSTSAANAVPWVRDMQNDVHTIVSSGYWDIRDKDAAAYADHLKLPGVTDAASLEKALSQQAHDRGIPAAKVPLVVRGEMQSYGQRVSRDEVVALEHLPGIVPLLQKWGYSVPTRAALAQAEAAIPQ